ncbi:hypothetical protein PENSPDRAFT_661422 [Peniophora sp. CONT]|nr:hypothetical protein PENSPDRAFT_661422 [Peniophora sp. CONT]
MESPPISLPVAVDVPPHEAVFKNGALVEHVEYPPIFKAVVERPMSVGVINHVQDAVEETVFLALARQSAMKRSDWPLPAGAKARAFAHNLFCHTAAPISIAMIVLGYLDRIKWIASFQHEELACERLLLGLFMISYKYIIGCPESSAAWACVSVIFQPDAVELAEADTLLLLDHDVGLSLNDMSDHCWELLAFYPDEHWEWLRQRLPDHAHSKDYRALDLDGFKRYYRPTVVALLGEYPVSSPLPCPASESTTSEAEEAEAQAFLRSLHLPTSSGKTLTSLEKLMAIKRRYGKQPVVTAYGRGRPRRSVRIACKDSIAERK